MKQIIPFNKEITFKTMISKITSISLEHTLELKNQDTIEGDFIVSGSYKMTEASQIDEEFSYKIPIEISINSKYDTSNISIEIDDFVYEVVDEEKLLLKIDLCLDNLEVREEIIEESIDIDSESDFVDLDMNDNDTQSRCIDENEIEDLFLETDNKQELEIPKEDNNDNNSNDNNEDDTSYNEPLNNEVNNENNIDIPTNIPYYKDDNIPVTNVNSNNNESVNSVASIFSAFKDTDETFATYYVYIIRDGDSLDTVLNKYNTTRDILSEYNDLSDIRIGSKIIIPSTNE